MTVYPEHGELFFYGKGNKPRTIYLGLNAIKILERNKNGDSHIINNIHFPNRGIDSHYLCCLLKALYIKAGIEGTSHTGRAAVATYLAEVDGVDAAMEQLGHNAVTTTMRYVRPTKRRKINRARFLD